MRDFDVVTKKMSSERPFVFSNLKTGEGVETIVKFIETEGHAMSRAALLAAVSCGSAWSE